MLTAMLVFNRTAFITMHVLMFLKSGEIDCARCGCWIRDCELLVLLLGIAVVCCCFVCGAQCDVCGIEGGASSHACCGRDGRAPIYWAAEGGHLSCLELLLSRNADVNVQDE